MSDKKLDAFAMLLIEKRQRQIENMGHRPIDPLPAQVREPVLYANALLTQLQMCKAEATTQELHVVKTDLKNGSVDFEI